MRSQHQDQPHIQLLALGAGQDVGRSCIVVTMGGQTIMFDCGMHVGYRDERRCGRILKGCPDLSRVRGAGDPC